MEITALGAKNHDTGQTRQEWQSLTLADTMFEASCCGKPSRGLMFLAIMSIPGTPILPFVALMLAMSSQNKWTGEPMFSIVL